MLGQPCCLLAWDLQMSLGSYTGYFYLVLINHHNQEKKEFMWARGSTGTRVPYGLGHGHRHHGGRTRNLKAHIVNHEHEAEIANRKTAEAFTLKPHPSDILPQVSE